MKNKPYRLIARSSNTNSFGLRGHVFMSKDGQAFEVARSDGTHHTRQFEVGKDYEFPQEIGVGLGYRPVTHPDSFELFKALPIAPQKVLHEVFALNA